MPKVNFIKKARKNYPKFGIKKGDSYYMWTIKTGPASGIIYKSKTPPKPSQLTHSSFLQQYYTIQENIEVALPEITSADDLENFVEEIKGEISNLKDELQGNLENMPEQLQESSEVGQLLQQRIDSLEEWESELDSLDLGFSFDEEELEELADEPIQEKDEDDEDYDERVFEWEEKCQELEASHTQWEENKKEAEKEWIEEKKQEIIDTSPDL